MSMISDTRAMGALARAYLERTGMCESDWHNEEHLALKLSYLNSGESALRFIEENYFAVADKTVLDLACGWGGHLIPFAAKGAHVRGIDTINYQFGCLAEFACENGLDIVAFRGKSDCVPYRDATVDIVLALDMIEHEESVEKIAAEIARILRPGGLCLVSTPPRLRSIINGEPHYGRRGFAVLPLFLQRLVTLRPIGMPYDDPIMHQYYSASQVIKPFRRFGLHGNPIAIEQRQSKGGRKLVLRRAAEQFLWEMIILTKPFSN
jgi:SAM-dependent methyltransferase